MKLYLVGLLLLVPFVSAQADDELVRQISVSGQASESVKPDIMSLSVTIAARKMELAAAKKEHDAKLNALLALAKKFGIEGKYLSTGHASIQPQWRWQNNTQNFDGYEVQTTLNLRSKNLENAGVLLEAVVQTKPQRMNGPNYYLEDTKPLQQKLRVVAVDNARERASQLAQQAGMKLGAPITISDSWHMPQPVMRKQEVRAQAFAAPVADAAVAPPQGEQQVRADVRIVYELKQK